MEDALNEPGALAGLIQKFEAAEEATREARGKSERDRDYYDGKQLTQEEHDELVRRGQPPVAFNLIKSRVEFLQGLEKKQRRDPKAWPRNNPEDAPAADAFTDGLRYLIEEADYETARSRAWKNITVEGFGGIELWAEPGSDGNHDVKMKRIPWDRIFYDPHSEEPDFSDATYLGQVLWLDRSQAVERYGEDAGPIFDSTYALTPSSETYDDKPRSMAWADRKRRRVRVVVIWYQRGSQWFWADFTRAGVLDEGESPYVDEDGQSYCPLILESAHVDRENARYGEIRNLIDPQDEVNKRRSKALWMVSTRGVIADTDAVADKEAVRKELARPDYYIERLPGAEFEIRDGGELAAGQAILGQQAMAYISQSGPNEALLGDTEGQSGKAIEARQAGGLIEQGDVIDTLRRLDWRVFRICAQMMKQFWTAEKWIRVTDDELSPQWVGLNIPRVEETPWGPVQVGVDNEVARLSVDIIITDAPDMVTLDGETFQALTQLLSANLPPPMLRFAIELHPGLSTKRKRQALDMLEQMMGKQGQPDPAQQAQMQMQMERAQAENDNIRAQAFQRQAQGQAAMVRAQQPAPLGFAY